MVRYTLRFVMIAALAFAWFTGHAKNDDRPDIKIETSVSKSGYAGEAMTFEVKVVSSSPEISNVRVTKYPQVPEGVKVITGIVNNQRPVQSEEKGKRYYTWTVMRLFLIPEKEGKITIGEGKMMVFIPHEKVVYHPFWGNRRTVEYEELPLSTKPVSIKVNRLPAQTGEYSGCVGDFKIEGWFPPGKINAGQDAYAVFTISGYGDLENLKLPNIYKLFSKNCQLKEVSQEEERMQRDGQLYSEVTLTCRFLPEEEDFSIEPLCLQCFNPETGKYYETCSETLHWTSRQEQKKGTDHKRDAIAI